MDRGAQGELFKTYPEAPGARPTDTSMAAADMVAEGVDNLRARVRDAIRSAGPIVRVYDARDAGGITGGLTADECAAVLGEDFRNVRPRCSELNERNLGLIADSGARRENADGNRMIVWIDKEFKR